MISRCGMTELFLLGGGEVDCENDVVSFVKIQTPSDANNGGGFSVYSSSSRSMMSSIMQQHKSNWDNFEGQRRKSLQSRYIYGTIFFITNLIAWAFRDYGYKILPILHYFTAGCDGQTDCFHALGVLRVSFGCFIFFFVMFLTTCKTRKVYDPRNKWHSGWWFFKFIVLLVSLAIPFFIPSDYIQIYGELAHIGAGVFLLLRLISVIVFITWWNNYSKPDDKKRTSCSVGLLMSTLFYIASIAGIGAMYLFYASKSSSFSACALNIFFISWTGILLGVMMIISLHSKVSRGILSSGIMASYIVFLCWTAIRGEPATAKCSPRDEKT